MNYMGDFPEDATVYIMFNTFTSDDPSASCTITDFLNTDVHIHKDGAVAQRNNAAGVTVSVNFDGITGSHLVQIDTSDDTVAGFWVTGSDYHVRIEGTTIDGATINAVIGHFSIENRFKEVTVTSMAANVLTAAAINANAITAAKIATDAITSDQLAASAATKIINDFETQSGVDPTGFKVNVMEVGGTAQTANDNGADLNTLLTRITAVRAGYLDNLNGHVAQTGDSFARIGVTGSGLTTLAQAAVCTEARLAELAAANLPTDIANIKTETNLIVGDTNELQTDWKNGGRLDLLLDACALEATVAALENISAANVRTQCDDALVAIKLDHLIAAADGDDPVDGSIIAMLAASDGDWSGFAIANDSLEAIRDRGDAAWTTGAGGTPPQLLQSTTIATLATQVSFTITAGSVDDNAYNGAIIVITDAVSGVQKAVGRISDYDGATKRITLNEDPAIFVMAVGDTVDIIATDKLFPICTEARLAELDAANIPNEAANAAVAAAANFVILSSGVHGNAALKALIDTMQGNVTDILGDTNELQGDWVNGGRLDLLLDRVLAATEIRQAAVNDVGATSTVFITNLAEADNDFWNRGALVFTSGANTGQMRKIHDYDGGTKTITLYTALNAAPANLDTFIIVPSRSFRFNLQDIAAIKTEVDTALSDVHLDDLIQLALTVNDGAPNTADFITDSAVAVDDWYNGTVLLFTSGALAGIARRVDDYDGGTKRIYLENAFPQAPANTDDFVIVGIEGSSSTPAAIADAVWDELEAGHVLAGSFGEEVTKQGKKLDRNLILDL